jgi:hypothetical protein
MTSEKNRLQNLQSPNYYISVADIFTSKLLLGTKIQEAQY